MPRSFSSTTLPTPAPGANSSITAWRPVEQNVEVLGANRGGHQDAVDLVVKLRLPRRGASSGPRPSR